MYNCDCLIHPFQNDPGTSQSDRVMDDLLAGAAKIDARTLADLLDYFTQMSRHINFYDTKLTVSDWQPFFQKSIPFALTAVIKTPLTALEENFYLYNSLFIKKPSSTALQLHAYFIFYRFVNKINTWHLAVKDSGLPIESFLEILIKDKLQQPLKLFIGFTNAAVKWYGIKKIDFSKLGDNPVWNLGATDLYTIDNSFKTGTYSKFQQRNNLFQKFKTIATPFFNAIKIISAEAEKNLEPSLLPLKEELQKTHPPHLALLFAFLNMFRQLQNDLNGFTRKHLDFFYKDVLQIKSRDAIADKTHIVFEIQKQLEKYLLKKGLLVKDGKDSNKQEILFSLDDDIVVNKTEVAETKTLFLNNQSAFLQTYVEGVYIANDATKADGIDKDFKDDQPKNFATLGAKLSKYSDPETKIIQPYANARIGFILASPVLYLKEGTRTITMSIACQLNDSICSDIGNDVITASKNCCDDPASGGSPGPVPENQYPDYLNSQTIFTQIQTNISKQYIYLNETIFKQAISKGLSEDLIQMFRDKFLKDVVVLKPCYCDIPVYKIESSVVVDDWNAFIIAHIIDPGVQKLINEIFIPESILNLFFSGDKDWLQPATNNITMSNLVTNSTGGTFVLTVNATINPDQPAVTFYNKNALKEDFDTTQPLVKIELNGRLKFDWTITKLLPNPNQERPCCDQDESCCLFKDASNLPQTISYYQFFRNITVLKNIGSDNTRIDVQVCGLKNFIVQNDESLQDVNGPVYFFGTRPVVRNFDIYTLPIVHDTANSGPSFYLGSKEVFCKNWKSVRINLNWKDKPNDFREYYKGYVVEDPNATPQVFGLDANHFLIKISSLEDGVWKDEAGFRKLFDDVPPDSLPLLPPNINSCEHKNPDGENIYSQAILVLSTDFGFANQPFYISEPDFTKFDVSTRNGFIKINLRDQDFLHKDYAFVLSRQMMALGRYPDALLEGAVYKVDGDTVIVFRSTGKTIVELKDDVNATKDKAQLSSNKADSLNTTFDNAISWATHPPLTSIDDGDRDTLIPLVHDNESLANDTLTQASATKSKLGDLQQLLNIFDVLTGEIVKPLTVLIPNEPWTPIISNMSLDYTATATIEDIDLIHLYPFAGTYSHEQIKLQPTLFPTFCDEGTLFLGLKNLVPGNNLNLLFELSEATSDSESQKEPVQWHYLDSNVWKPLRSGFEVLDDASENLTTSGIIKFAMPANMTSDNTIMPDSLYWIKASVAQNSKAVSETTAIFPQAIQVTFTNDPANDKLRLSQPLVAGSISKLEVADANVKSVQQPYDSFGGEIPEIQQQFYVRVSEELRHKERAIQKFDYERLALQEFPQLFKVKCISHSFALDAHLYKNDFPYAPGYIILAVIPDLNKLKAGNSFQPKVPVSILEKIETYIRNRTSPFVRFRAMNPRYEEINFCLRVNLLPGKDENFYKEQLKEDLKELLAPWAVGKYDKLTFGQCVYRSDIIRFLEQTDYVDFITDFQMAKASQTPNPDNAKICPDTPRSILIAGNIEVCINQPRCDEWMMCYDNNQNKTDCCTTELIPVANYCIDKNIPIE
ncbi:MAG TPA: hypothetical protein VN726_09580 [Hanamia sp.]|nr:hypothetical protein [Hanamia sp.]